MERLLMKKLLQWKESENRKPLILKGARQVGKTWLMKEFGKRYFSTVAYISFFNNTAAKEIFNEDYEIERITQALEALVHKKIDKNTLIIFDEIQEAPKAIESLKYFCEEAREYYVIAAGSLLGLAIHSGISFPVGKVSEMCLYPMNFKEFLMALGEERLSEFLDDFESPNFSIFFDKYERYLRQYLAVGGMPEVVGTFINTKDYDLVRENQLAIIQQYEGDFTKHINPTQLPRLNMTWHAIPVQLAKENKKFFFGQIKKGARMSDFEIAIEWLINAGLIYKVNQVTKPGQPLRAYVDFTAFKIYLVDVGLLGALSELSTDCILGGSDIYVEFKGAMAEQFVLQEIIAAGKYTPFYYSSEKGAYEVDFLIQKGAAVVPIEVKAKDNLKAKSLKFYCEKYKPEFAVRTSCSGVRKQEWMVNIPLWAIGAV